MSVDIASASAAMKDLQEQQLPFTIARALTMTAQSAQMEVRKELPGIFKLRNDWTVQGIRITPATKQSLVAEVRTDTANRATGAPDYLPRQDYGGEKVPLNGRQHIAVPTKFLRMMLATDSSPIPEALRPRALMQYADQQGQYTSRKGKLRSQPTAIKGMIFFLQKLKSGESAIMARYITDERNVYPMYLLIPMANIRGRFPMEEIVQREVERVFAENFRKAAIETMGNDYLRGSGVYVKF